MAGGEGTPDTLAVLGTQVATLEWHRAVQISTYFLAASLARTTGWCPLVLLQQSQGDVGEHLQKLSSPSAAVKSWLLPLQPPTAQGTLQAVPIM